MLVEENKDNPQYLSTPELVQLLLMVVQEKGVEVLSSPIAILKYIESRKEHKYSFRTKSYLSLYYPKQ